MLIPAEFEVLNASVGEYNIRLSLLFCSNVGFCPLCHSPSRHVHSHYLRKVRDLPISGKEVELQLCCRKFFCDQDNCPRKVFAQQASTSLKPYARRLERATEQILAIGLSMGSKPGASICRLTGIPISASTVLRVLRRAPSPEVVTPSVLGVDDFAFRKRNTYGTILVDLERRKPIDLLPDREGKTLENWLIAHPGIAIVSRDRSSVYANAIRNACPEAIQVADRWHLLKNLGENTSKYLDTQRKLIGKVGWEISNPTELTEKRSVTAESISEIPVQNEVTGLKEFSEKRYAIFKQVKQLQSQNYPIKSIARHLGISRNTVRKYFSLEDFVPRNHIRRSNLSEYIPYLYRRREEGEYCVKTLFNEIKDRGYNGSYTILTVFMANLPKDSNQLKLVPTEKRMIVSSRSMSLAFCQLEEEWEEKDKPFLKRLMEKSFLLRELWELNLEFRCMMEKKKGNLLQGWCEKASQYSFFKSFVKGIQQDFDAVYQAVISAWSNGQTEGQVNRLKNLKRQMYGRAGFDLLRIRVLARTG